ncbi:12275_t:CDS:2 [Entrophospora sp. SA101]|nr:12275_t:CDS:2 [Entrophospora sp. SA101]CAJ0908331.1 4756_t:CDS:2 [Entrophospora sp. SA101]
MPNPMPQLLRDSSANLDHPASLLPRYHSANSRIARYGIIFLPENNKFDQLRGLFTKNEWKNFEEQFIIKIESSICKNITTQISKIETVLNHYKVTIEESTIDDYVDLDKIDILYKYPNGYKFRTNWLEKWTDNIYQRFGEIDNKQRKTQRELAAPPKIILEDNRAKMLKAMRLGFHHLEKFLHDEGPSSLMIRHVLKI